MNQRYLIEALGMVAAAFTTLCWVPQAIRTLRTRDTRSISLTAQAALALYSSAGFRRERAAGKEEEKSEGGEKDGSSSSGGISLLSSSSLAAAAMKLYHRALCRFFLGTSRWVRLAMPLLGGEVK